MNKLLKQYFGYDKLKDKQEEIIKNVIDGNDTIAILATGYGKSICYQLPYLITNKSVIVISPLISLMEDQFSKLKKLNITSYCLNSNNINKQDDINKIINGENGIIYMSPEYFLTCEIFIKKLQENNLISLFAIDESHCISTWSDFRPEYNQLSIIKQWTNNVPILALTASATQKIIKDVNLSLNLENPKIISSSFYRSNLNINILKKYNKEIDLKEIISLINKLNDGDKAIIYCKTKNETDDFVLKLKENNIKSKSYHAGKSNKARNTIQDKFMNGKINIIVATIAFGMGVDLPNIRLIINYGISKDMESFYQEIGRAGRDGVESNTYLFWSNNDFNINKSFLNDIEDVEFKKNQMKRILEMEKFVNNNGCRMKYITNYFNEKMDNCGHCDFCKNSNKFIKVDISKECFFILKTIKKLKNNFGTTTLSDILFGSTTKKITPAIKKIPTYGKLNNLKKIRIKEIIRFLIINEFLNEEKLQNSFGSVIKLSNNGILFLNKYKNYEDINEEDKFFEITQDIIYHPSNNLEDELKKYRKNQALKEGVNFYQIFPNKTIEALQKFKITKLNDLQKVDGLGKQRIKKYGNDIIQILNKNPIEENKETNEVNKLLEAGLTLSEIDNLKNDLLSTEI